MEFYPLQKTRITCKSSKQVSYFVGFKNSVVDIMLIYNVLSGFIDLLLFSM